MRKINQSNIKLITHFGLIFVLSGLLLGFILIFFAGFNPSFAEGNVNQVRNNISESTQTITVTTSSDVKDGDCSSIANLLGSPGADGEISLREGITAANNSSGKKEIRFHPSISGSNIIVGAIDSKPLPVLSGGDITINGDIDRDGTPDINLDGSLGAPDTPLSHGLTIWSDNNTISGISINNFLNPIEIVPPSYWDGPSITISGNKILSNTIEDGGIVIGPLGWHSAGYSVAISNITWQNTIISGNQIIGGSIFLYAGAGKSQNNEILSTTISANQVISASGGISILAADTNTSYHGIGGEVGYSDNNLVRGVLIADNTLIDVQYRGIQLTCANMGNRNNQIQDVEILNNTVINTYLGIMIDTAGEGNQSQRIMSNNHIYNIDIRDNWIEGTRYGISLGAGGMLMVDENSAGISENTLSEVSVVNNDVVESQFGGIVGWAGMINGSSTISNNITSNIVIQENRILTQTEWGDGGIYFLGGWTRQNAAGSVISNTVENLEIEGNTISGFEYGIRITGGSGNTAINNRIHGMMASNKIDENQQPYVIFANTDNGISNILEWDIWWRNYIPLILKQ